MAGQILIPEDAPFSAEQREWLNDFFARVLPGVTIGVGPADGPAVPVTILYGSQTGNAEGCARKMAKSLNGGSFETEVFDMAQYDSARLPKERNLLIITSTYGDGEPPDSALDFYQWLHGSGAPKLEGVRYSVLGLGDTEYPDFCKCAVDFDNRLAALGATRFLDRVECDVDYEEPFAAWRKSVMAALGGGAPAALSGPPEEEIPYGKKRPFPAPILDNRNLNGPGSGRETQHVALSLEGSGLTYEVGDALGVIPCNPEEVVDEILGGLSFNTRDAVPLPGGGEAPLREALLTAYDIRSLSKKLVEAWQGRSGSPYLRSLVGSGDKQAMDDFVWGRELVDLVVDYPADFADGEEFVSILKKLQPRLYSIASSPKAHPGEVHLTVAIVRYHAHGRDRGGVCSTFLADRCEGVRPGVFVHTNKAFRLPESGDTPVIMVGPGTGIAPFRAFLEERRAVSAKGKNWLFFGNPHRATDFLYEDEFAALLKDGTLTRLDTAFSRDQDHKIYVQDRMLESGSELWQWLQDGAFFYVCGDASRMAKDVDAALHAIVSEHGGLDEEAAAEFVKDLRKEKRYARDVY